MRLDPEAPDWFKRAIAADICREWVEVDGAPIEVLTCGPPSAAPILFLHGMRAHADWWSHLLPLFGKEHRVASISWSGMGRSGWRASYSIEQYRREAIAVCEEMGLFAAEQLPAIVAHSFGGYVAALIAAQDGERFRGAVIVDSSIRPKRGPWPEAPPPRTYATLEEGRSRFRFAPPQQADSYIVEWLAEHALKPVDGQGWTWRFDPEIYSKLEFEDVWDLLSQPKCPIAMVRGGASGVVSDELAGLQSAKVPPGTPYVTIPGAGHHLMADAPLPLVRVVRDLLADWDLRKGDV